MAALLLALGLAAPARATTTMISMPTLGPITINAGDEVDIVTGGSVTVASGTAVTVSGGTLNMPDGTVSSALGGAVDVSGGTATISGGTVSGTSHGVDVFSGGTATISGGSVSATGDVGVVVNGGTAAISGSASVTGTSFAGVFLNGAAASATISGGAVSGTGPNSAGVEVKSGTATISGTTSVSGAAYGVKVDGGTANISGGSVSGVGLGGGGVYVQSGSASISGGMVTGTGSSGVIAGGGVASISGGNVSGRYAGLAVGNGATANISGGSVTGTGSSGVGVAVNGGSATLSGGSVSGALYGLEVIVGTLTVVGCNLMLSPAGQLTGLLADGTLINIPASVTSPGQLVLQNSSTGAPQVACPANVTALATSLAGAVVTYPPPLVTNACGSITVACTPASGSTFAVATTTVTCTATDKLGNVGSCQFNVTVLPIADLALGITASLCTVRSGTNLTYTLLVTNAGPFTASGVIVNDPVPSGAVFVSATPSPSTAPPAGGDGTVSWNVGDLTSGQGVTLTVVVKVTQKGKSTISNTATVTSSTADPNPGNNSATLQTKVIGSSR